MHLNGHRVYYYTLQREPKPGLGMAGEHFPEVVGAGSWRMNSRISHI